MESREAPPRSRDEDGGSNPFGASASAMFSDFERVKSEENKKQAPKGGSGDLGDVPPGMNEAHLNNLEKQFTGLFQNIVQQMENMEDGEDDEDEDLTEEEKKEAEQMMKSLFGAMGVDPTSAAGGGSMPGASSGSGGQADFAAQMLQFEQMFKNMGM